MKQSIILSMIALSALTVFSCSKSQDALDTPAKGKVLVAYTDDNVNTRTALQNEVNVIWNSTDAITGFDIEGIGHQSQSITVDSQNASKATFQFGDDLSVVDDIYCALYPADASATMNDYGVITTTLPVSQVATAGSFGPGANIAVADGGNENLRFFNGGALLSFTVNNDNVKKVKLTVSGDNNVAGPVYASMNNGVALVQSTYASQIKSVSLEGDFVNGSDYYFVVLPGEYTGLQLDIENAEGKVATLKNKNALTVNRNDNLYIANLPDLTAKWAADVETLPDKVFFKETFGGEENTLTHNSAELVCDNTDWVLTKAYATGANEHTARFGASSEQGIGVTPEIAIGSEYKDKTIKLFFKAAAWGDDATTMSLEATNASLSESSVTLKGDEWSEYEIDITDWTSPIKITFKAKQKSKARFFLDDIYVYYGSKNASGSESGEGDDATEHTATLSLGPVAGNKIDDVLKTFVDDEGNTWTVTTEGTTSFTNNNGSEYSQVGSSKKPATSISFTTTLAKEATDISLEAKFGGFGGTAGTISLKVGNNAIGTGSLNETEDVTVSSTETAAGKVLTVAVTNISKGVKCYFIKASYKN